MNKRETASYYRATTAPFLYNAFFKAFQRYWLAEAKHTTHIKINAYDYSAL